MPTALRPTPLKINCPGEESNMPDGLSPSDKRDEGLPALSGIGQPRFAAAVFAGGGNRCFWQAGFWSEAAPALGLGAVRRVAATSAGAAIACVLLAGRLREGLAHFRSAVAANPRNVHPGNLFRGRPVFPHAALYRRALLAVIDRDALARLHAGPELLVPVTRAPGWLGMRTAFAVAGLADALEHVARPSVHPRFARRLGFAAEYVPVRRCPSPEALADLVLASSCTPPFTPALAHGGRPALDGGIADNVPAAAVEGDDGPTLVLLTRRYPRLPGHPGRVYVQPSAPVAVSAWDYTDPDGIAAAFDLGRRDGEAFASTWTPASASGIRPAGSHTKDRRS
jgi:predicted acylesterase/phospholipase RssA